MFLEGSYYAQDMQEHRTNVRDEYMLEISFEFEDEFWKIFCSLFHVLSM